MKYTLKNTVRKPSLYSENDIVTDVSSEFVTLSRYSKEVLIGKSLAEVSCILKLNSQICLEDINNENNCFMFTKENEPREVNIACTIIQSENEKKYFFKEKANSRVENKNMYVEQLCKDNQIGVAIYSSQKFVLLKANDKRMENYYNNKEAAIGKTLKELVAEKEWSRVEKILSNVTNSGNSYYGKEVVCEHELRETKYFDISLVPIYIEGKIKYVVETSIDVTERVANRKLNEEKTEQMEIIIKNISDGVFICDKEGKTIIANNKLRKIKESLKVVQDAILYHKYFDMYGNEIPYENLPMPRALKGEKINNERMLVNTSGVINIIQCNATPIYDESGNISFGAAIFTDITELYNKENVIKNQKNELESIIENMYDGFFVVDRNLNITVSNHRVKKFLNLPGDFKRISDAFENLKYYDFDGNLIIPGSILARSIFRGECVDDLRIAVHKDDGVYYLSFNGSPIIDKEGNVEKAIISARNITEQVKKDRLIKEQNDMLNAIMDNMSDELIIIDKNGQYEMANKVFRNLYSTNDSELINPEIFMNRFKLYDEDRNIITSENIPSQRIKRGEKFSQYRIDIEDKNGFIFHTESSGTPIYDSEGKFIAGVVVGRNINDRLKNEENKLMKAQYDILQRTIENLQLNFVLFEYPDIKIEYINRNAFKCLREFSQHIESIESCIGKSIYEAFNYDVNEKFATDAKLKELINNKGSHFIITRKFYKEGKENYVKVIFQPLYNLKNEVKEVAVIGTDITEEILAKNKIEEASKLQGEIFINVSHELKTPLNVIFSSTQLMEMYLNNDSLEDSKEKIFNNIKIIKQNCYRFIRLINNILDTSKIKSGFLELSLSNKNIVEVVENIVQSVSEYIKAKGINIIFDTNTEEKYIACDANKIERIMLNLISNAVKFSNKDNSIYINVLDKNDAVEITVRDTGIGMDKKDLDSIFNIYHQVDKSLSRNAEGTGIGLSLVKSFVEMHGGKISVDSEVGRGTIFKIELPSKIIEEDEIAITTDTIKPLNDKIEMVNVEFSDIYSI